MRLPSWGQSLNLHSRAPASIQPHLEQPPGLRDVLHPTLHSQALPSILQAHLFCGVVLFAFTKADTKFLEAAASAFLMCSSTIAKQIPTKAVCFAQYSIHLLSI